MKALFALAMGALLASSALAQSAPKQNEVFLGVGDAGLIFYLDEPLTLIMSLGTVTYGDQQGGFQVVAGYQRRFGRWSSLGVTGSWAGSKKTAYFLGDPMFDVERRLLTLMVDGRAHWLRRPSVDLYSGLAFGVGHLSDDLDALPGADGTTKPSFHVIPVGVRFGRNLGAFFETGVGLNGFVKAGLSQRF